MEVVKKKRTGRPRLLRVDATLTNALVGYLEKGMYLNEACSLAGVARDSVYAWMAQGVRDKRTGKHTTKEAIFSDTLKKAMASAEELALARVLAASQNPAFWASAAWFLERRYPDKYGKRDRVALEHAGQMGLGVAVLDIPLSDRLADEDKRNAAKAIARNLAIIGSGAIGATGGAVGVGESGDNGEDGFTEASFIPE